MGALMSTISCTRPVARHLTVAPGLDPGSRFFTKRNKRWRREWEFALAEKSNPDWAGLAEPIICATEGAGPRVKPGATPLGGKLYL